MTPPSAYIFDLDGTLLDTLDDLADSMNATLASLGLPVHPVDAYRTFVGEGIGFLIARTLPGNLRQDPALLATALAKYQSVYAENWHHKTTLYPGIQEMLTALQARGVPLGVLSNKPDHFTQLCIDHYFPAGTFRTVFGQREHVLRKPDPAGALEIAALWQLAPADIAYVGDTSTDMETGRSAGMQTIGVAWGFRPVSELVSTGAHHIIQQPSELLIYGN